MPITPGSLLRELDLTKEQFLGYVDHAARLKKARLDGSERPQLAGRQIALVFEKNSTRTRCAFEVAAHDQGAQVTFIGPDGSHLGKEETVRDTARVLGRLYDGIAFRGFAQEAVGELAAHAGVPVWNALTDAWHPTQMLADVLTMIEHFPGPVEDIALCYCGDGRNNVARSLLVTGALLGMDVRIAAPALLQPPDDLVVTARRLAAGSGASLLVSEDPFVAVRAADFVYTDVWLSMGEPETEWKARVDQLRAYQVTAELMAATGKPSKFLHCLPSVHNRDTTAGAALFRRYGLDGAEVDDEVFESSDSIVFDQAENRMHTIKAVLVEALGEP